MFNFEAEELGKFNKWNKEHKCENKEYSGAIGGRLTYCFTPTGLGTIKIVKCACGEEIDVTNYDW